MDGNSASAPACDEPLSVPDVCAPELCFAQVFAARASTRSPALAHTWATFVRAAGSDLQAQTVSWLPKTLHVRVFRLWSERGVNLDLEASLRLAYARNLDVSMWGPYQIDPRLYDRALEQLARLRSGAIRYKAIDTACRRSHACNCVHAVSDIFQDGPFIRLTLPIYGNLASQLVADWLKPWILNPHQTHDWIIDRLGISHLSITRRSLD